MAVHRLARFALTVLVGASACASHEASPAFRRALVFDDRGISVPLPPPSLIDEPEQEVDVHGTIEGDPIAAGTRVHVEDTEGDAMGEVELAKGATSFGVSGLVVDLRRHCLEVWLETPDGRDSEPTYVRAHIVDAKTLATSEGCE